MLSTHDIDLSKTLTMKPIQKIRVLIDMDGVIADLDKHQLDIYRLENPDYPFIPLILPNVMFGLDKLISNFPINLDKSTETLFGKSY